MQQNMQTERKNCGVICTYYIIYCMMSLGKKYIKLAAIQFVLKIVIGQLTLFTTGSGLVLREREKIGS